MDELMSCFSSEGVHLFTYVNGQGNRLSLLYIVHGT